jgi:polyhydroxybutyrate depolymerase
MTSAGVQRQFQLIVPKSYDGTEPMPIVFSLHPDVISYRIVPPMVGFPDMAAKHDFIGVSPSGLLNGTIPYWMAVRTEPPGHDIVFFSDLLDLLEAELCVDPSRVYATGMANGSQMASLLACQLGDRMTAVAPLAGPEWPKECDGRPVPVLAIHGDKDPFTSYLDGRGDAKEIADKNFWKGDVPPGLPNHEGAEKAMANWAEHNGCDPTPLVENISDEVIRTTWHGCEADTVFYHVVGGGHTWPSRPVPSFEKVFGYTTMDIDATELMFEFFFAHRR